MKKILTYILPDILLRKLIPVVFVLAGFHSGLLAQFPGGGGGGRFGGFGGGGSTVPMLDDFIDTDSISIGFSYKETPWDTLFRGDTSLYHFFHLYDPARRRTWDYLHTGLPGSPSRPVYFSLPYREGNHLGINVFDIQVKRTRDMPFYQPDRPYADLTFLRGADQDDFIFDAIFSHTFENRLNFTLDYQRIGQVGEYQAQRQRNTSLALGMHTPWSGKNLKSWFTFATNSFIQEAGGGITTDTLFNRIGFENRIAIPIFLDDGRIEYTVREWELYNTFRAPFTTKNPLQLYHSILLSNERYKFFDIGLPLDAEYYGPFLTDSRGVRHLVEMSIIRNEIGLDWSVQSLAGLEVDKIRGGLVQRWVTWTQEPVIRNLNEVHLFGEAYLQILNSIDLKGRYQQGLFEAAGNSNILLNGDLRLTPSLRLSGTYERTSTLPSLIDRQVNISFRNVYQNDFSPVRNNRITGGLQFSKTGTSLEVSVQRSLDAIVYNIQGQPEQLGTAANVFQVALHQRLRLWKIQWHHYFLYQASSETKFGIPPWFYKSSLFYESKWFRAEAPVRFGVDFRTMPDFYSLTFLPFHGQFAWQDEAEQRLYPELDAFFSMKVKIFKAFFRVENITNLFWPRQLFHHFRYPMHEFGIRLGIHWILPD